MKNILLLSAFILVISGLFLFNCSSSGPSSGYVKGEKQLMEGWIDENTFQIRSDGVWSDDENGKKEIIRRNSARAAAELLAQGKVIEKFVGFALQGAGMTKVTGEGAKGYVEKRYSGTIKGGSIKEEVWNDKIGISIIYQVQADGLKDSVNTSMKNLSEEEKKAIFGAENTGTSQ